MEAMDSAGVVYILDMDQKAAQARAQLFGSANLKPCIYQSPVKFLRDFDPDRPCCLVSSMRIPELSGLELLARLQRLPEPLPAIMIAAYDDIPTAVQVMKLGAVEFLEPPILDEHLLRLVLQWININRVELDNFRKCVATREKLAKLSAREWDVLEGILNGLPNKELARRLGVSPKSIEVYRQKLMTKMEARSVAGLVREVLCCPVLNCSPISCHTQALEYLRKKILRDYSVFQSTKYKISTTEIDYHK
jgi:two-component system response regulator FixJ